MVRLRDEDGNYYEVSAEALTKLEKVTPPVADGDAYFPATEYRWDPRGDDGAAPGDPAVTPYHWQPAAYRWHPTDYRWHPPQPGGQAGGPSGGGSAAH